ncbi:MAG: hydrogenase nickel incorporation protein HypB [Candidatus Eremiobacteraeota bacterium]|nr:hydrogenase nickel incorporation protein HypB [Candidatus Eremiobacteraeota bacterium]
MEVKVLQDIMKANDSLAEENASLFKARRIFAVNMMSSPGSGKTTILERTLSLLAGTTKVAVIEGDVKTTLDAERLAKYQVPVVQIHTELFGSTCHLDANMVMRAFRSLPGDEPFRLLFVENVGNLVCPAGFKLGTDRNVVVLSVTEGEDKPLKYPAMFRNSDLLLINKVDLLPHLEFSMDALFAAVKEINAAIKIITLSAKTGEGFDGWTAWLAEGMSAKSLP